MQTKLRLLITAIIIMVIGVTAAYAEDTPESFLAARGIKLSGVKPAEATSVELKAGRRGGSVRFWLPGGYSNADARKHTDYFLAVWKSAKAASDDGKLYNTQAMQGNTNEANPTAADIKTRTGSSPFTYKYKGADIGINCSLLADTDAQDKLTGVFEITFTR